jgi:hypothetical protein
MDFLRMLKNKCYDIDHPKLKVLTPDSFAEYQVIKTCEENSQIIACGLTKAEAQLFVKSTKLKLKDAVGPNNENIPYFRLEIYKILLGGRELVETHNPKIGIETTWVD